MGKAAAPLALPVTSTQPGSLSTRDCLSEGGIAELMPLTVPHALRVPLVGLALLGTASTGLVAVGSFAHPRASTSQAVTAPSPVPRTAVAPLPQPVSRSRSPLPVKPLRKVVTPDLMLTSSAPLTQKQVAAVLGLRGVKDSTVVSTGAVRVEGRAVNAMGVDPSSFRMFTPKPTAQSDALWASVARDEFAASYAARLPLGNLVHAYGKRAIDARIGAVASYDLPIAQLVMDRARANDLGLRMNTIILTAPDRRLSRLENEVREVLGDKVLFTELRPAQIVNRRPKTYRELYILSAGYCPGLSWKVLAAIGQVESDHGRNVGPSSAGALGPMQFLPSTWASYGVDGDGDGKADIMSPYDAVPSAALYLCRNGAGRGGQSLYDAIFNYNHADWYVREVLALAAKYA